MAKYRVWFNALNSNRIAEREPRWVVQSEDMGLQTAPGVSLLVPGTFVTGPAGSTPQGWCECEGQAFRDGKTNFVVIRPL